MGSKVESRRNHRAALRKRQRDLCALCGERMLFEGNPNHPRFATLDHVVPRSLNGANARSNLRLACKACNNRRGNTPPWMPRP